MRVTGCIARVDDTSIESRTNDWNSGVCRGAATGSGGSTKTVLVGDGDGDGDEKGDGDGVREEPRVDDTLGDGGASLAGSLRNLCGLVDLTGVRLGLEGPGSEFRTGSRAGCSSSEDAALS